jgi:ubiquinol-cytochrome c reductase cytochrome b subunit
VWFVGVVILVLMITTAFLGYVLPWGQMSFWGATVITNLFTAVPIFGKKILMLLWGGYSITSATLVRFYALHFLLPFIILGLALIHVFLLHLVGSNNPLGVGFSIDKSLFYLYVVKDFYGTIIFFILFSFFVFVAPNYLGHSDNYIEADPLLTPAHIVPEWYFLLFYAILRSIPDKLLGILTLALALIVLGLLPIFSSPEVRSMNFRPYSRICFYLFMFVCVLLTFIGGRSIEYPFVLVGQLCAIFYFLYFLYMVPLLEYFESFVWATPVYRGV